MATPHLGRRLLAELIGTALLVVFGAGAVIAALRVGDGELDYAGLGMIGISFALVISAAVYAFGGVSGGHINPAVTFALAVVGRFAWREVPLYCVVQLVGALLGGLLLIAIFGTNAVDANATGGTALGTDVSGLQGVIAEGLGTFLLLITVMALAVDRRAGRGAAGLVIGLVVACAIMVIGPLTGGSLNPARTFGPYLTTSIFGGSVPWKDFWIYLVGPLAGGVLAVVTYECIAQPDRAETIDEESAAALSGSAATASRA